MSLAPEGTITWTKEQQNTTQFEPQIGQSYHVTPCYTQKLVGEDLDALVPGNSLSGCYPHMQFLTLLLPMFV